MNKVFLKKQEIKQNLGCTQIVWENYHTMGSLMVERYLTYKNGQKYIHI